MSSSSQLYSPPSAPARAGPYDLRPRQAWPTMLFVRTWADAEKHRVGLVEESYRLRAQAEHIIDSGIAESAKPEKGLFESKLDLLETTDNEHMLALAAFLRESVAQVVHLVNGKQVPVDRLDVNLKDSWVHVTNHRGFHDAHYHGGCSWCGIYYIEAGDVPDSQPRHAPNGVNRFYSPIRIGAHQDDYGNQYLTNNQIDIPPRNGMVVLFPAYLLHSALPYEGTHDRVILAFNSTTSVRR